MKITPFFPAWRPRLAPMGARTVQAFKTLRACTLSQIEDRFGRFLPESLFPKAAKRQNSRDRIYTRRRTFWCMLWQSFNPSASGREVVRQLQALFVLHDGPQIAEEDAAYCRAKARLPLTEFPKALAFTAQAAQKAAPALSLLQGRQIKVTDGATLTMADTAKNRKAYPALQTSKPNFPIIRAVGLFCLASGAILSTIFGNLHAAELPLLNQLLSQLVQGDILMGDRGFGNFILLALLQRLNLGIDFLGRSARGVDGRHRLKRLAKNDWLVLWKKGSNPSLWLPLAEWLGLPTEMTVRIVRGSIARKGFRVRQLTIVTTLLDPQLYPAEEILQVYLRRWRLEMCLNDLKTTLEMETLRSLSPEMAQKEVYARLIVHNLIRCTMIEAANEHEVALERISFKGTVDALRQFTQAICQARSKKKRQELWAQLLQSLAADQLPDRPGRREPRAVKRVKNKYDRLNRPRHQYKDRPKRSVRRAQARLRKLKAK